MATIRHHSFFSENNNSPEGSYASSIAFLSLNLGVLAIVTFILLLVLVCILFRKMRFNAWTHDAIPMAMGVREGPGIPMADMREGSSGAQGPGLVIR